MYQKPSTDLTAFFVHLVGGFTVYGLWSEDLLSFEVDFFLYNHKEDVHLALETVQLTTFRTFLDC